jgi:dGTPase
VLELGRFIGELVHRLMSAMIGDLVNETRRSLSQAPLPMSTSALRERGKPTAGFSPGRAQELARLKAFLLERMYRHPRVADSMTAAKRVIADLFAAFSQDPNLLPADWRCDCAGSGQPRTGRVVRDYIAGMTDRFALLEHRRIFHTEVQI